MIDYGSMSDRDLNLKIKSLEKDYSTARDHFEQSAIGTLYRRAAEEKENRRIRKHVNDKIIFINVN